MEDISTMDLFTFFALIAIAYAILFPQIQLWNRRRTRLSLIRKMENKWGSKILSMVHRKEAISFFGFPVYQFIDIEDAEQILRGIRSAGDKPIDIILHTPGGQLLPSIQIASALKKHSAKTRAIVPHYAMSGGTLIALACDEILMDPDAAIGPIDPQIGDLVRGTYPAHSWIYTAERKGKYAEDTTFIMRDISEKALRLMKELLEDLLKDRMEEAEIQRVIGKMLGGEAIHSLPISASEALLLKLPVNADMPKEIHEYMSTFASVKTGVEYLR